MAEQAVKKDEGTSGDAVEAEAKGMGWSPKEDWRGDPERWVDAETFVTRGHEILPILKKNNEKLTAELGQVRGELTRVTGVLKEATESMEALKQFNTEQTRRDAKETKTTLLGEIKEARDAGNIELEAELTDKLSEVNTTIKEAEVKTAEKTEDKPAPVDYTKDPGFQAWLKETPWFGKDIRRTSLANGIAAELRANPEFAGMVGREFLDKVTEEVDKTLGGSGRGSATDRVEAGRGGGGSRATGAKSFADLPADAQAACNKQEARLVGPNRAFKNQTDWRKHYVAKYYEE